MFNQNGSVWVNWITLQDRDSTATNQLFSGSLIYCYVNDVSFTGKIEQATKNKIMPDMDYIGSASGSVWSAAISNNSFTGVQNHAITLKGNWTTDLGSYDSTGTVPLLTPYKMIILATSGKTFYLNDERIIKQIIVESGSVFYPEYGIPVVITDYSIGANSTNTNSVGWSMTIREDKVN